MEDHGQYKSFRANPAARPGLPLAVIVGAGGMGMAIARRLGERNRLLVVDRDRPRLEHVREVFRDEGYDGRTILCDITDSASVAEMASEVSATGPLKAVVHVAALAPSSGDAAAVMRVNLAAPRLVMDAVLPLARVNSVAILISSAGGHQRPLPSEETLAVMDDPLAPDFMERLTRSEGRKISSTRAYILSKCALNRMARKEVWRWADRGARIVSVSPGPIATPMGAFELEHRPGKKAFIKQIPLAREGSMLEVADLVDFLASDRASFITGTDILIDGGASTLLE
jgi:NAD(P)-dependent dehydrogenase (short-subunit alcohol dehydrogenase family)